jgi:inner membrane protein
MDPASHGLLSASWAESSASRNTLRPAVVLGALSGMAPDLDILIRSSTDPLLFLEYHRHFTHALAFTPIGALLCALMLHTRVRNRLAFRETYLFCLLGYASHGLLDACTSFGTHLLWPFSDLRVAWSIIAVVDPAFTVPVLALVVLAVRRKRVRYAQLAALWAVAYLAIGVVQHLRAEAAGAILARERGHTPVRVEAKPAFGSLVLWKVIYEHDGRYYVDAVRAAFTTRIYTGESIAKLDVERDFAWLDPRSRQAADIERFRRVSDDLLGLTRPRRIASSTSVIRWCRTRFRAFGRSSSITKHRRRTRSAS